MRKYSVILSNVGSCCDRYLSSGYSKPYSVEEMFSRAASIPNISGVELVANWHISEKNVELIRNYLLATNLQLVSIIPDHFGQEKWGKGAFSSKVASVRKEAIEHTKQIMDIASELGCSLINIWPGQDGYDYCFQADYLQEREWFEEGIRQCCSYRSDVKIALEYKIKEPRNRSYPSTASNVLLMVKDIDAENLGVTIDYGHAVVAYENPAETVALLSKHGQKLFHIHMNDNYGQWDDDMIAGSVHTIQYVEFLYWLDKTGYEGWISMDQYPYREDGVEAVKSSVEWLIAFERVKGRMDLHCIEDAIRSGNTVLANSVLRNALIGD